MGCVKRRLRSTSGRKKSETCSSTTSTSFFPGKVALTIQMSNTSNSGKEVGRGAFRGEIRQK